MKISSAVLCKLRGLSSSEWFWGCREASKSGLSSFGAGNVTVSVIRIPGLNIIIIESVFGLIWPYSSKTSPKLGYSPPYVTLWRSSCKLRFSIFFGVVLGLPRGFKEWSIFFGVVLSFGAAARLQRVVYLLLVLVM